MNGKMKRGLFWIGIAMLVAISLFMTATRSVQAQNDQPPLDEVRVQLPLSSTAVTLEEQSGTARFRGDVHYLSQSGEPAIPYQVIKVLLPPDADLTTVSAVVEKEQLEQVPGVWDVAPVPPIASSCDESNRPIWLQGSDIVDGHDVTVYGADAPFPASPLGPVSSGNLRKWVLTDTPVALYRYNPVRKELFRLTGGELVIRFSRQLNMLTDPSGAARFADQIGEATVRNQVVNFAQMAPAYTAAALLKPTQAAASRYMILTTQAIQAASQQLANFVRSKENRGFIVQVVTEETWGGGTGDVAAEHMRQWLQAHYLDLGIEYVLFIGNPNWVNGDVPMKMLWPSSSTSSDNSPSDYYYTDLTGNWDADGDGFYGEPDDLIVGGIDRNWEVLVGRIPYYGNLADLDHILAKLIAYENTGVAQSVWRQNVLLPMVPSDAATPGYQLGEAIKNTIVAPKDGWHAHRIYRETYGVTPPPETTPINYDVVANVWNASPFGAIFWWTHGWSQGAVDVVDNPHAATLNDNYPGFTFQASCDNAYPEDPENLSYMLLKNGAIATVGATRVSWYFIGETEFINTTSNAGLAYQYAKQLISNEQDSGHALQELKLTLEPGIWMNWTVFNLYGDPAQGIFTAKGIVVNTAADPGDGICDQTECTLREAIDLANATPGMDSVLINIPDGPTTIALMAPLPTITDALAIDGNGYTVDAQGNGRVFTIELANVLLRGLTLRGGRVPLEGIAADSGGGIKLNGAHGDGTCGLTLIDSTVEDNGAAAGGAIANLCDSSLITLTNSIIRNNYALQGGGIYIPTAEELFSELLVTHSTITGNRAENQGGGIFLAGGDAGTNVTINDSTIASNTVISGPGGGLSVRTGEAAITNLMLRNVTIFGNTASTGGGLHVDSRGNTLVTIGNSTISSNQALAGTGGGLFIQGVVEFDGTDVRLINSTIANNAAAEGGGIYKLDGLLTIANTLIAMNTTGGDCTLTTSPGAPSRYVSGGHNLDSDGTCLPETVRQPSDIANGNANLGPLADNGAPSGQPTLTHALLEGSAAIDAGDDTICAAAPINGVDQRGIARPQGAHCDIGAFEVEKAAANHLFISSNSNATAGGVKFRDEDILAYDLSQSTWHMVFDGSDVGVTKDVDAFTFLADDSLLLSFNTPTNVPGLGKVDDSDIVHFIPTVLGSHTAGTFAWVLRGADVGLTTDGEDIDAIDFDDADNLVISTSGDVKTSSVTGKDEDLLVLYNATLGNPSAGEWRLWFDGSTVGLANEDVNGLWIDPMTGDRYLTVKDSFAFADQQIDSDDVFVCTPTQVDGNTVCRYTLFWDGDQHNYGSENIDSIHLGALPTTFVASVQASAEEPITPEEAQPDEDADDLDGEENNQIIYLPMVER